MFHLITHAFFKALLFLGAGSVIIGMHHEQDMRKMGGLRKKMPVTFWMMWIGTLALTGVGIPQLVGFAGYVLEGRDHGGGLGLARATASGLRVHSSSSPPP